MSTGQRSETLICRAANHGKPQGGGTAEAAAEPALHEISRDAAPDGGQSLLGQLRTQSPPLDVEEAAGSGIGEAIMSPRLAIVSVGYEVQSSKVCS
jgi:hypothetical protein